MPTQRGPKVYCVCVESEVYTQSRFEPAFLPDN